MKRDSLADWIRWLFCRSRRVSITLDIEIDGKIFKGAKRMQMFDDQQGTVFARPTKGKDKRTAQVEPGSALWTGPNYVAVHPAADGLSAVFVAVGIGSGKASVSYDADLGAGIVTISREFPVIVTARLADNIEIFEDAPVDQVAAGPDPNPPPAVPVEPAPAQPASPSGGDAQSSGQ